MTTFKTVKFLVVNGVKCKLIRKVILFSQRHSQSEAQPVTKESEFKILMGSLFYKFLDPTGKCYC